MPDHLNHQGDDTASGPVLLFRFLVDVKPRELRALFLSFLYYFLILSSYYIIRPIRDDFGAAGGLENLPWMFTGTLVVMLAANALFSALVARYTRRRFIPVAYRFLIANLLIFFALLFFVSKQNQIWIGRAFFVWTSVFNLFVVSVFWAFMVDVFNSDQGKRLFGFISVGGTLGAIVGAAITASLVRKIGSINLLLISALLLELSAQCVRMFPAVLTDRDADGRSKDETAVGGRVWAGIVHNFKSPYLLGISAYMLLYSITSTLLYFQQIGIAASAFTDRAARTAFFAKIDLAVNILTIVAQAFVTGRLLKWLGVGLTLAILPALSVIGFMGMGVGPTLTLLVLFLTVRRAGNYAFARPARETLFTVISREDKYKAKNFIDTVVYRVGDQIGAWTTPALGWLGLKMAGISLVAAPLAAVWLVVSLWLGKRQSAMTRTQVDSSSPSEPSVVKTPA
ncbi:MAG TPA: MFS transporter [Pyrinomonadaceae bacterium]|nr:MFS transporter [Pyrinomonadaceae bacterium]